MIHWYIEQALQIGVAGLIVASMILTALMFSARVWWK